jgi:hypothetical protein
MIAYWDLVQGTMDWHYKRMGIPTASEFARVITPGGKVAKNDGSRKYARQLVAETLLQKPLFASLENVPAVQQGHRLEPAALGAYQYLHPEVEIRKVGFVVTDDGKWGCSPDRLVIGQPGGLEVKSPEPIAHIEYMIDGFGDGYKPQFQGQMLVAELEWVDMVSYSAELGMPLVVERMFRDEPYIAVLRKALTEFCDMRDEMLEKVRAKGFFDAPAASCGVSDIDPNAEDFVDQLADRIGGRIHG